MTDLAQDYEYFDLTPSSSATDPELAVPPLKRVMGPGHDVRSKKVEIRIGRRPIAHSLRAVYEATGRKYPKKLSLDVAYRLWLISLTAGVIRYDGFEDVQYLIFEVWFPADPHVTIQGIVPQTHLIDRFKVDTETRFTVGADVQMNGEMAIPEPVAEAVQLGTGFKIGAAAGAEIHAGTKTDVVGRLSYAVASPIIQSVGVGDHQCKWVIKRERSIVGDQVFMITLLVPELVDSLAFDARVGATVTTFDLLKDTLLSPWVSLQANVPRDA